MNSGTLKAAFAARGYRLEGALGAGGFGEVHRAVRIEDGQSVAIKVMHAHGRQDTQQVRNLRTRFGREADVLSKLDHPGCVQLLDFGALSDGTLYMVQEFIDGWTLQSAVGRSGLDPVWATRIAIQVLDTLADAHRQGVVHRDIKPTNIMLTRIDGQHRADTRSDVRVLDFGIAKVLDQGDDEESLTKGLLGTPKFMAPEQARGDVGPYNDIYAVGILLVYLLTGQAPFTGHYLDVIDAHRSAPRPTLPNDPLGLQPIVTRALAIDRADRYLDATAMKAALEVVLRRSGHSIDDIAETVADSAVPIHPPHRRAIVVAISLLLVFLGTALALSIGQGEGPAPHGDKAWPDEALSVEANLAPDAKPVADARTNAGALLDSHVEKDAAGPDASPPDAFLPDAETAEPDAEVRRNAVQNKPPRRTRRSSRRRPSKPTAAPLSIAAQYERALVSCECSLAKTLRARLDRDEPGARRTRAEQFYLACEPSNVVRKCK